MWMLFFYPILTITEVCQQNLMELQGLNFMRIYSMLPELLRVDWWSHMTKLMGAFWYISVVNTLKVTSCSIGLWDKIYSYSICLECWLKWCKKVCSILQTVFQQNILLLLFLRFCQYTSLRAAVNELGQLVHCDEKHYSTKYYPVHLLQKRNVSHRVLIINKISSLIWLASVNYVYI